MENAISFQPNAFRKSGGSKDGANVDVASVWNRRRQLFSHASNTTFPFQRNDAILPRTVNDHGVKPENSAPPICLTGGLFFEGFLNPTLSPSLSLPLAYLCQHEVVDKRVPVFSCVEGRTKRFCPREVIPGQGRHWLPLPFIVQPGHRPVVYRPLCSATLFPLYTRPLSAPIVHPSRLSCQRKLGKQRKTRVLFRVR